MFDKIRVVKVSMCYYIVFKCFKKPLSNKCNGTCFQKLHHFERVCDYNTKLVPVQLHCMIFPKKLPITCYITAQPSLRIYYTFPAELSASCVTLTSEIYAYLKVENRIHYHLTLPSK